MPNRVFKFGISDCGYRNSDLRFYRPRLEMLETRELLTTFNWINAAGGDFNTAANWDRNAVPGAADDAVINISGITVTSGGNNSINSLTSIAKVQITGGSFNLAAASTSTNFELDNGVLGGAGTLSVSVTFTWTGGTMNISSDSSFLNGFGVSSATFNNAGALTKTSTVSGTTFLGSSMRQ